MSWRSAPESSWPTFHIPRPIIFRQGIFNCAREGYQNMSLHATDRYLHSWSALCTEVIRKDKIRRQNKEDFLVKSVWSSTSTKIRSLLCDTSSQSHYHLHRILLLYMSSEVQWAVAVVEWPSSFPLDAILCLRTQHIRSESPGVIPYSFHLMFHLAS